MSKPRPKAKTKGEVRSLEDNLTFHYPDSERFVVACCMNTDDAFAQIEELTSDLFFVPHYRELFELTAEMVENGLLAGDGMQRYKDFASELTKRGRLEAVGGLAELSKLLFEGIRSVHIIYSEVKNRLLEAKRVREVAKELQRGIEELGLPMSEPEEVASSVSLGLATIKESKKTEEVTNEAFDRVERELADRMLGEDVVPLGVPTGVPSWDKALRGLTEGEMFVLAARPGEGKTSAMETAIETQIDFGMHVLAFPIDMPLHAMLGRMACRRARVSYSRYLLGQASGIELDQVEKALCELKAKRHLLHFYNGRITPDKLDAIVRREKARHDIKAFYLDHFLQLHIDRRGGNLTEGLTLASARIRSVITETGVPGVILVHLNREATKAARPSINNIKYCDALYADCDRAVVMWSEEDPREIKPGENQSIWWSVEKNRMGALTDDPMLFRRHLMTFLEV